MSENEKNIIADFRHHYYKKYNVQLDDDILYILIRINELNVVMKSDFEKTENKIKELEKTIQQQIVFKTKWDYFVYGLGKYFSLAIILASAIFVLGVYIHTANNVYDNSANNTEVLKSKDSVSVIKNSQSIKRMRK